MEEILRLIQEGTITSESDLLDYISDYEIEHYAEMELNMVSEDDIIQKDISDFTDTEVLNQVSYIVGYDAKEVFDILNQLKNKYVGHFNLIDKLETLL